MTARKDRPFRTLAELQALLESTPAHDRKAIHSIKMAIKYRTDPEFRLRGVNRLRKQLGTEPAKTLDDIDCRVERVEKS